LFIINFFRYLFGTVVFVISGNFPERFLNLCAGRDILLWDIKKIDGEIRAEILAKSYKKLRPIAKKTRSRLRITRKKGLPFKTRRYKKRYGLFVGAGMFAVFLYVLSLFVWNIEIYGNSEVDTQSIRAALEYYGVKNGVLKGAVIPSVIEQSLILEFPKISKIAIIQKGSTLKLEVREGISGDGIVPSSDPCHLVAARAGIIENVKALEGQMVKKKGEAVSEGDIIISGIVEDSVGNSTFVHSRGSIMASTERTFVVEIPYSQDVRTPSGKSKIKPTLHFFAFDIPLWFTKTPQGDYNKTVAEKKLFNLPISYKSVKFEMVKIENVTFTEEQAREKALKTVTEREKKELSGAIIISQNVQEFAEIDKYRVVADYKCTENIAVEQKIMINR